MAHIALIHFYRSEVEEELERHTKGAVYPSHLNLGGDTKPILISHTSYTSNSQLFTIVNDHWRQGS
jgi:hypothetical protein